MANPNIIYTIPSLTVDDNLAGAGNQGTTPAYSAFAVEQQIRAKWRTQWTNATALEACIRDRQLNVNKGFSVQGTRALFAIQYLDVSGLTAGITDANEIPAAWPTWDATDGFTQASHEYTHYGRSMTIKASEDLLAGGGTRGNLFTGKTNQLMAAFRRLKANDLSGSGLGTRANVAGLAGMLNNTGVYGGIDRATYSWWVPGINSAVGPLSLPIVNNAYDSISVLGDESGDIEKPDLFLLGYSATVNSYGRLRELIAPSERIVNAEFRAKYGFDNFIYLGMKCVADQRLASGTAYMLSTSRFFYGGYDEPRAHSVIRILGSDALEHFYSNWCFFATDEPRRNFRFGGITG